MLLSACSAAPEAILTVKNVRIDLYENGSFSFLRVDFFDDESRELVSISGPPTNWFENAEFVRTAGEVSAVAGIDRVAKDFQIKMAEDCKILLVLLVDGKECAIGFGEGSQFATKKTRDGYKLLADKTAALSPPPAE